MEFNNKIELALILTIGIIIFFLSNFLPLHISFARLILLLAATLLLQSLARDLWILRQNTPSSQSRKSRCICVESILGITGIILGGSILLSAYDYTLFLSAQAWSLLITSILIIGFISKDYILELSPLKIRKEKNHLNIVFKWKK